MKIPFAIGQGNTVTIVPQQLLTTLVFSILAINNLPMPTVPYLLSLQCCLEIPLQHFWRMACCIANHIVLYNLVLMFYLLILHKNFIILYFVITRSPVLNKYILQHNNFSEDVLPIKSWMVKIILWNVHALIQEHYQCSSVLINLGYP